MSTAVLERPTADDAGWVILDETFEAYDPQPRRARGLHGVTLRGRGVDHHGVLKAGRVKPVGPDRTPAPSLDELDF